LLGTRQGKNKGEKNRHREFNVVRLQCVCLRPRLH